MTDKMDTVFKVGDVVYDSVTYPNQKGEVKSIDENSTYALIVLFEKEELEDRYLITGATSENRIPTLSFTPYELKGFTQERTWLPKEGEWIAVRDKPTELWTIVKFKKIDNKYFCCENFQWLFAKPLKNFIDER